MLFSRKKPTFLTKQSSDVLLCFVRMALLYVGVDFGLIFSEDLSVILKGM